MGAPSSRAQKRTRPNVPAPTFRPGIAKLYEEQEHHSDNPDAALKRWSGVGQGSDATFEPRIGEVYEELEASGQLRVDSINSRVRWEKINGSDSAKSTPGSKQSAASDASAEGAVKRAVGEAVSTVKRWLKSSD